MTNVLVTTTELQQICEEAITKVLKEAGIIGGDDTLDTVGCFRALDFGNFQQLGKHVLMGFDKQVLPAFLLMDLCQERNNLGGEQLFVQSLVVKCSHLFPLSDAEHRHFYLQ